MANTKTPFFGLASHGTVGKAITSQKRGSSTLLRKKPIPAYRLTLPQQYHRWLYRDYTDLWLEQSEATKQEYRTAASRYHMTGMALWQRQYLRSLEDIAGWWRLDELSGAVARDSSPNLNHGTVIGATVQDGLISKARHFDALDDRIKIEHSPALDLTSALTLEMFINSDTAGHRVLISKGSAAVGNTTYALQRRLDNKMRFFHSAGGIGDYVETAVTLTNGIWYHVAATITAGNLVKIYIDGVERASANLGVRPSNIWPLYIGSREGGIVQNYGGILDNCIIYNRTLTPEQVQRHSERRYP